MLEYWPSQEKTKRFVVLGAGDAAYNNLKKIIDELSAESDRGAVIVGSAFLDEILQEILVAYAQNTANMEKLVSNMRSSTVADLCLSLGLISQDERDTLKILTQIRNKFAHRATISFDEPYVESRCDSLQFVKWSKEQKPPSRDRYLANIFNLIMEMEDRPSYFRAHPVPIVEIQRVVSSVQP